LVNLDKLCTSVLDAYKAFILGDIDGEQGLKAKRDEVKKYIRECEAIHPKCDPSLQIVPGFRTPFKFELYGHALVQFRLVLSDMDMLVLAMTGHEEVHNEEVVKVSVADKLEDERNEDKIEEQEKVLHKIIEEQPAWKQMSKDLLETVECVADMLKTVLAHDTEEPLDSSSVEKLKQMDRLVELEGVDQFYSEVCKSCGKDQVEDAEIFEDKRIITQLKRTRLNVAVNALGLTVQHIAQIPPSIFNNMIYS